MNSEKYLTTKNELLKKIPTSKFPKIFSGLHTDLSDRENNILDESLKIINQLEEKVIIFESTLNSIINNTNRNEQ